jgi:hypothetical protein
MDPEVHRSAFESVLHEKLFCAVEYPAAGFVLGFYGA